MDDLTNLIALQITDHNSADDLFSQLDHDLHEIHELLVVDPKQGVWVIPLLREAFEQALEGLRR